MPRTFFLALLQGLLLALPLIAAEAPVPTVAPKRVLLVAPFENQSTAKSQVSYEAATSSDAQHPNRTFTVDRYSEAPRAILENALVRLPGVTVVERQRVDALLLESDLGAFSGLGDSGAATRLGRLAGATTLIMGTVLRVDALTNEFQGYGVAVRTTTVTAQVRVRAVDVATGTVTASGIYTGSKRYQATGFGGLQESDVAYAVLETALTNLTADVAMTTALTGGASTPALAPASQVPLAVTSVPDGADILVDGVYRGTTPTTLQLPATPAVRLRLERRGCVPWEHLVEPATLTAVGVSASLAIESPAQP